MTTRRFYLVLLVCVLAAAAIGTPVLAQNQRMGTAGAAELLIPVGARDLAMGNTGTAASKGIEAMYWNPAGVSRMTTAAEGMFSYMSYIADLNVNYGAVAVRFQGAGTFAFDFKSVNFGDISLTTNDDPEGRTGQTFSPGFNVFGFGYSRHLTDAISAGVVARLINERIDLVSASGVAFDFGVQYTQLAGIKGLGIGVAVKNIGPQMKFDGPGLLQDADPIDGRRPTQKLKLEAAGFELPSVLDVGLSYDYLVGEQYVVRGVGTFVNNNLGENDWRFGAEVGYTGQGIQLFGRGGYGVSENEKDVNGNDINPFGMTLGAGLAYSAPGVTITIDYAWRDVQLFSANNIFSVKLGF